MAAPPAIGKLRAAADRVSHALRRSSQGGGFEARARARDLTTCPRGQVCCESPSATTFDYEFAGHAAQRGLPAGDARRRPRCDPGRATHTLRRPGRRSSPAIPASRRSTTSRTSSPTPLVPRALGRRRRRVLVVLRTPPDVALYHRQRQPALPRGPRAVGRRRRRSRRRPSAHGRATSVVRGSPSPSLDRPRAAVDAQSLIALADLVVSAGGTMNREAAALGVPVYTSSLAGSAASTSS